MRKPEAPIISARDVWKAFGDNRVLRGIDLDVWKGTVRVILGASGSGKSVLLKHIIGLLRPDRGSILVGGTDITRTEGKELDALRLRFGMVFQTSALFDSMTVADNVAFPLRVARTGMPEREIREIVRQKLALVHLEGVEDAMPAQLSGGMRKRVALARAVAREPEIVLYDEPTTGLDPITVGSVNEMILEAKERLGVTSLVISHDIQSALRIGDEVSFLHEGRIVFSGTPADLLQTSHPYVRRFLQLGVGRP